MTDERPLDEQILVARSNRGPLSQGGTDEMVVLPGPRPETPPGGGPLEEHTDERAPG